MEEKEKKEMICVLCRFAILSSDDYLNIRYFHQGKFHHEEFCHMKCWKEKMQPKEVAMQLARKANVLLNKVGVLAG